MNNRICNFSRRLRLPNYFVGRTGSPPVHYDRRRRLFYFPSMRIDPSARIPSGNTNFYTNSTPKPDIDAAAIHAVKNPPPAQVEPASMTKEQFRMEGRLAIATVEKSLERARSFVDEFKRRWKEFGATKALACEAVFGQSLDTLRKRLERLEEKSRNFCPDLTIEEDKSNSLNQVAKLPDPVAPKPTPKPQPQGPDSEEAPPPKPKVEPVKDKTGVVVPARCLPLTERRQEVTEMEYHASKLAALFEKLQTNNDVLYSQLRASGNIQTYMNHASTMRYTISHCIPDVVCPACKGDGKARTVVKERDWCYECAGSGMISEVKWNREWVKSGDRLKLAEVERRRNGSA